MRAYAPEIKPGCLIVTSLGIGFIIGVKSHGHTVYYQAMALSNHQFKIYHVAFNGFLDDSYVITPPKN